MKVEIVYVLPLNTGSRSIEYAFRFVESYHANPPGVAHTSTVVLNAGKPNGELYCLFSSLQGLRLIEHDDSGWDIGAYQKAASQSDADLIVFFGTSAYLKNAGWLLRFVQAVERRGDGIFGAMGNRGNLTFGVYPHIRTTGFCVPRDLFNRYPTRVKDTSQRYPFEHGENSISQWVKKQGKYMWVVTKWGEHLSHEWDNIPNGFHRGDQSALLCGDRVSEPPFYPVP